MPIFIDPPLFSIITVAYNNLSGIISTEKSIRFQKIYNYEWIVIDGGSSDGTLSYLQDNSFSKLKFISEPDDGIYDAMGKGIALSCGHYVIFMNSGDVFSDENVLCNISKIMGESRPEIIYGDSYEQDGKNRLYKPARKPSSNSYVMFTHHQSIFYSRELAAEIGFDKNFSISGDWVMTSHALRRAGEAILAAPFAICAFERGGISQSKSHRRIINREHFRIYRTIQGHSLIKSIYLWTLKVFVNKMRELFPQLYDILRYARH